MEEPKLKVVTKKEAHNLFHSEDKESVHGCSFCGSSNVYGISRVVGYYSPINNWNLSKQAELDSRQRGDYKL